MPLSPTWASRSSTLCLISAFAERGFFAQRKRDVVEDRHGVEQRRALKQHAEFLPHVIERALTELGDVLAVHQDAAAVRQQERV